MKKISMTLQIMIATALGILAGLLFGGVLQPIKFIGDIFLRLIQMSIVLLVLGQIVEAVGNLNPRELGKLGVKTVVVFFASSLLAAVWGIVMGVLFKPGSGVDITAISSDAANIEAGAMSSIQDTILSFFPGNIVQSMADNTIVHVIVFGILFGIALGYISTDEKNRKLLDMIIQFNKVIIKLVSIVMKMAPLGIFVIIATTIGQMGIQVVIPLAKYLGVYALGTLIFLVLWLLVVCAYCKVSLPRLARNMFDMSIMALATTSSAVTLPTALKDCQEKLGIGEKVSKLVMPLGMSLNSNGSAMHMAITIVAIAQMYNIGYGWDQLVYIAVLATLASLANAVVPGAGLVSLAIVVPTMGLPLESIALLAGVEWFVGMLRTILNVDSDAFTAMLVAKSEKQLDHLIFKGAHTYVESGSSTSGKGTNY